MLFFELIFFVFVFWIFLDNIDCDYYFTHGVVVAADVLWFTVAVESFLDCDEAEDADEYADGVVEDVGGEIPEAFVRGAILIGECDGDGQIDEVGEQLGEELFGCVEEPYPPGTAWLFFVSFDDQYWEGEDAETNLYKDSDETYHIAVVILWVVIVHGLNRFIKIETLS